MNKYIIPRSKFRFVSICTVLLATFLILSCISAHSQIYRSREQRNKNNGIKTTTSENKWKKNILWLDGMGSSQVVSIQYERIMNFGPFFSARFGFGVTPFLMDEKYNFIVGRSITPTTGVSFVFNIPPSPIHFGFGCTVLHDVFFDRIPETLPDATGKTYPQNNYRARVMPFAFVEGTIKGRYAIRGGYSPIIDPANDGQTATYITHWAMIGFGYKFGK
jgi:hypothetical protein